MSPKMPPVLTEPPYLWSTQDEAYVLPQETITTAFQFIFGLVILNEKLVVKCLNRKLPLPLDHYDGC